MKNVIVLAGGPSVKEIDLSNLRSFGHVIGVNDSAKYASVDECVSMDRLWFENRWRDIDERIPMFMRREAIKAPHERRDLVTFENDRFSNVMSEDLLTLNGSSSGMCAVNRGYHLKPDRLFLVGFDMSRDHDGNPYWYPPYPWARSTGGTGEGKYIDWSLQFSDIAAQFKAEDTEVYNVGMSSRINNFQKISTDVFNMMVRNDL